MKTTRPLGLTVLAAWLVLTGILPFLAVTIPFQNRVLPLLALLAGILLLIGK